MNTISRSIIAALLLIGATAAIWPQTGLAMTMAGTSVTNTATATYKVNGITTQTPPAPATSTFKVDDKIMFTVTPNDGGAVTINTAGNAALSFTVTNVGNNTHDFALVATKLTGTVIASIQLADNANGTITGLNTSGSGTVYIDELAPQGNPGSLPFSKVVYVYATAASDAPNGMQQNVALAAIAHCADSGAGICGAGTGNLGALSENTTGDKSADMGTMFTVLADDKGTGAGDAKYDGQYIQNAQVGFQIAAPIVSLAKLNSVYEDEICTRPTCTNPRAIPGAKIIYSLTVANGGLAAATDLAIEDILPTDVTLVPYVDQSHTCVAGQVVLDDACKGSGGGLTVTIAAGPPQKLTVSGMTLDAAGGVQASHIIKYMVTIN